MDTISIQTRKLNGCVKQVENLNPSGASEKDILDRAKVLFMQDPKYSKGFKFDHVWDMIKNFEKIKDNVSTTRHAAPQKDKSITTLPNQTPIHHLQFPHHLDCHLRSIKKLILIPGQIFQNGQ
ncbi:unnamed protein product [Cuscuta epithymum]|uniref:No apical meristem-associated C-terminal domain-containing protein n=1 Tax=Cuscuta epithymum TaxID=186058 RepID=A0AAV0EWP8_9ASTE|nr:unnamed protein product [Cuscuta epithymum]